MQVAFATISQIFHCELMLLGADTPVSKAVQISIDCTALLAILTNINVIMERFLQTFLWFDSINTHLPSCIQDSKTALLKVSLDSQDLIVELLNSKINDLLGSLEFINFVPTHYTDRPASFIDSLSTTVNSSSVNILTVINQTLHHEVIDQLIQFLQITFMSFSQLPSSAREVVHFTCCSKVGLEHIYIYIYILIYTYIYTYTFIHNRNRNRSRNRNRNRNRKYRNKEFDRLIDW